MSNLSVAQTKLLKVVRELGCLEYTQALQMFRGDKNSSRSTRRRTVDDLIKKGLLFLSRDNNYLLPSPKEKAIQNVIDGFYVVQRYLDANELDAGQIYKPELPATIGFVDKNGKCFEVIVPSSKETILDYIKPLQEQYDRNQIDKDKPYLRYIFVVRNKEEIRKFPKNEVTYPFAFAYYNYKNEDGISFKKTPTITYYVSSDESSNASDECGEDV